MVLTHASLSPGKLKWSQLHEVGHFVLPEHNEILWKCKLSDLDFLTRRRLELEANQFAAEVLFQGHRFRSDAASLPVSVGAILTLRERYGASLEATARRYVEDSYFPCALIVYEPSRRLPAPLNEQLTLKVRYTVTSASFTGFRYLLPGREIPVGSPLHEAAIRPSGQVLPAEFRVMNTVRQERRHYETEIFHNTYRIFQLVLNNGTPPGASS
jgi:hypothetical protein